MIELILRVIVTLILAALKSLGSADPAEPPTGSSDEFHAVPIARGSEKAAAIFSLLRAIDPCGLHDVAAATRVTGDRADQIIPTESLSACLLRVKRRPLEPTWTFTTRVGVAYPTAQRNMAAQEEVDGRRVYRDESADLHARSCTYTRPVGTDFGISLTASAPIGEPTTRPCPVARAYLSSAQPLTHLVLRLEKRTEPRFTLAAIDPCAATLDILNRLGMSGAAHPEAPHRCRIQPDAHNDVDMSVMISFGFGADPTELAGAGTGHMPVTVADHTGLAAMVGTAPQRCELTLVHDPDVAIHLNRTRFVQTIGINAASCEQAKTVAGVVLGTVATR